MTELYPFLESKKVEFYGDVTSRHVKTKNSLSHRWLTKREGRAAQRMGREVARPCSSLPALHMRAIFTLEIFERA